MRKIGVFYLDGEYFEDKANQTIGKPILGPTMEVRVANRREVTSRVTQQGKALKEQVVRHFMLRGIGVILRWSKYAGCPSCPCSPGFNILTHESNLFTRHRLTEDYYTKIWVTSFGTPDIREPKYSPLRQE